MYAVRTVSGMSGEVFVAQTGKVLVDREYLVYAL